MAEHMKGPWAQIPPGEFKDEYYGWDYRVGPAVLFVSDPPSPEDLANAHLISAAPDLLEALQEALAFIEYEGTEWTTDKSDAVARGRAAIRKATGEKS